MRKKEPLYKSKAQFSKRQQKIHSKNSRPRDYLEELIAEEIVVTDGGNKNRVCKLKA